MINEIDIYTIVKLQMMPTQTVLRNNRALKSQLIIKQWTSQVSRWYYWIELWNYFENMSRWLKTPLREQLFTLTLQASKMSKVLNLKKFNNYRFSCVEAKQFLGIIVVTISSVSLHLKTIAQHTSNKKNS